MRNIVIILSMIAATVLTACSNQTKTRVDSPQESSSIAATGPDAIIYKTKSDYNNLVPVMLNDEKTEIVSFPAPKDLKYKGKPAIPTTLAGGFLLDNRGIGKNVAFLDISYEDYMALKETPSTDELNAMIIDKDPLTIMYNCGKRQHFKDEVEELNAYILDNDFSKFTKLK